MPFRSQAQRKFMYAKPPEIAERWEKKTSGPLPEKSLRKEAVRRLRRKREA